jgi:hypothetical protein
VFRQYAEAFSACTAGTKITVFKGNGHASLDSGISPCGKAAVVSMPEANEASASIAETDLSKQSKCFMGEATTNMDRHRKNAYHLAGGGMKFKNRLKRLTDILEKLGVTGLAIGVFQDSQLGLWMGIGFLVVSIFLTMEDS